MHRSSILFYFWYLVRLTLFKELSVLTLITGVIACVADALNLLYIGLYKGFRRVRGPAATQAMGLLIIIDYCFWAAIKF